MKKETLTHIVLSGIGLLADLVGLATFVAGVWGGGSGSAGKPALIFLSISPLIIIYSWFALTYAVTRTRMDRAIRKGETLSVSDLAFVTQASATAFGILCAPIAFLWFLAAVYAGGDWGGLVLLMIAVPMYFGIGAGIYVGVGLLMSLLNDYELKSDEPVKTFIDGTNTIEVRSVDQMIASRREDKKKLPIPKDGQPVSYLQLSLPLTPFPHRESGRSRDS